MRFFLTDRLVEIRTILERMRPVEHKLKYQIEKLLKLATTGKLADNDPLQFKANPDNLISKVGSSFTAIWLYDTETLEHAG